MLSTLSSVDRTQKISFLGFLGVPSRWLRETNEAREALMEAANIYDPISPLCNKSSDMIKFFFRASRANSFASLARFTANEIETWIMSVSLFNQNPSQALWYWATDEGSDSRSRASSVWKFFFIIRFCVRKLKLIANYSSWNHTKCCWWINRIETELLDLSRHVRTQKKASEPRSVLRLINRRHCQTRSKCALKLIKELLWLTECCLMNLIISIESTSVKIISGSHVFTLQTSLLNWFARSVSRQDFVCEYLLLYTQWYRGPLARSDHSMMV